MFPRVGEGNGSAQSKNNLATQLSNGQQQCHLPQRAAAQALSGPLYSLSTGPHQNEWVSSKELQLPSNPRICMHTTLHSEWNELHLKIIKYLFVFEWTPRYKCSHANHLSLSLSHLMWQELHNVQCMQAGSLTAISFLRTRQVASNSCKFFQLILTSCNYFQLSFSCLLLDCTLDLLFATAFSFLQSHLFVCCWAVHWF